MNITVLSDSYLFHLLNINYYKVFHNNNFKWRISILLVKKYVFIKNNKNIDGNLIIRHFIKKSKLLTSNSCDKHLVGMAIKIVFKIYYYFFFLFPTFFFSYLGSVQIGGLDRMISLLTSSFSKSPPAKHQR